MDFGFSQEQEMLRATARKFLDNECTSTFVRARMEEPAGVTDEFWAKLAEQGWLGLVYPEEYGGTALGFVDLTVLMEEMGRCVMPGPFVSTVLLGGLAILEAGSVGKKKEWLPGIAAGEAKAALAWTEPNARWDAAGVTATAREGKGGVVLTGTKLFVLDAHTADVLVVVARTAEGKSPEGGVGLFLVPKGAKGMTVKLLPTMDATRKLCEVSLKDVTASAPTVTSLRLTSQSFRVASMVGRSLTVIPLAPFGTRKRPTPPSGDFPSAVRATTTRTSAVCASSTKSFVPVRTTPPLPSRAVAVTPAASQRAFGSVHASAAFASPAAIPGSHSFFFPTEPASRIARPPRRTVETNGPGITQRPISSISTVRSTKPRAVPPYSSG